MLCELINIYKTLVNLSLILLLFEKSPGVVHDVDPIIDSLSTKEYKCEIC